MTVKWRYTNKVTLSSDPAVTVFTLPDALSTGDNVLLDADIMMSPVGATDFGGWTVRSRMRNLAGTITTSAGQTGVLTNAPGGGLTDASEPYAQTPAMASGAVSLDLTVNPPVLKVARPPGVTVEIAVAARVMRFVP
jgi:hypothetical protein